MHKASLKRAGFQFAKVGCDSRPCHQTVDRRMCASGFVAQTRLWTCFPLPRTDSACGHGTWYAQSCDAVQDRGTDLDLCDLAIKSRAERR